MTIPEIEHDLLPINTACIEGRKLDALKQIDILISSSKGDYNPSMLIAYKVMILEARDPVEDRIGELNTYIGNDERSPILHYYLSSLYYHNGEYDKAFIAVNDSDFFFRNEFTLDNDLVQSAKSITDVISKITSNDLEVTNAKISDFRVRLEALVYFSKTKEEIAELRTEMERTQLKFVETLGLFTGVIAFVFANVQLFSKIGDLGIAKIFIINLTFIFGLAVFALLISIITRPIRSLTKDFRLILLTLLILTCIVCAITVICFT